MDRSHGDEARQWLTSVWMDPDEVAAMDDATAFQAVEEQHEGGLDQFGQKQGW